MNMINGIRFMNISLANPAFFLLPPGELFQRKDARNAKDVGQGTDTIFSFCFHPDTLIRPRAGCPLHWAIFIVKL